MKKILNFILFAFFMLLYSSQQVNASDVVTHQELNQPIKNIFDCKEQNLFFGYSIDSDNKSSKLMLLDRDFFTIKQTLSVDGIVRCCVIKDEIIYLSLINQQKIVSYDLKTLTKREEEIETNYTSLKFAFYQNYIIYTSTENISIYDLETKEDTILDNTSVINKQYTSICVDETNHMVYFGENNTKYSNLFCYSMDKREIVSKTIYNEGNGFDYPNDFITIYNDLIYWAGRDFHKNDVKKFEGDYLSNTIYALNHDIVFTKEGIFDRENHIKLGTYPYGVNNVTVGDDYIILYCSSDNNKQIKYSFTNGDKINKDNICNLIGGKKVLESPHQQQSDKYLLN